MSDSIPVHPLMNRSPSRRFARFAFAAMASVALTGCDDAPTEPSVLVVAAETEAALSVSGALPTLPVVVEHALAKAGADPRATRAFEWARTLWLDAEAAQDADAAAALRRSAYDAAAPALARTLEAGDVAALRDGLGRWIEAAGAAAGRSDLPGVQAALGESAVLLARAERLGRQGRTERSVRALLEAGDRLRETTPRAVARRLIQQAEEGLATVDAARVSEVDRRRAERLLNGAREALGDDDPIRAIRRAYYARQLLDLP